MSSPISLYVTTIDPRLPWVDPHSQPHVSSHLAPELPEGSKWERNLPPPSHVLVMTAEEEQWYQEAMKP
eukprot:m.3035 g.3035  ORF g.3035 m.3035 type:complete len:69 (+) comp9012_c0_seq2:443-649(+)